MTLQASSPCRRSALAACLLLGSAAVAAGPLGQAIQLQAATARDGVRSQERVDQAFGATRRLLEEYKAAVRELESLRRYNDHLEKMTAAQEASIHAVVVQTEGAQVTRRDLVPLMSRMVDTLDRFVTLDVPFRLDERRGRVKQLGVMIDSPDVSLGEKYRQVLQAYQAEADYGRTVDAYRAPLALGGKEITVDYLRVGRIALLYRSLDGGEMGFWDRAARAWRPLPGEYHASLDKALRVARKESAPDLLMIPIVAPESLP
jgi:hypothetical protein